MCALVLLLHLGTLVASAACASSAEVETETRTRTFDVGASPALTIKSQSGSVIVIGGPEGKVTVEASLRDPGRVEFSAAQSGDGVTIDVGVSGTSFRDVVSFRVSRGADLRITAPPETIVNIETLAGGIELRGLSAGGSVRTGNGPLRFVELKGSFSAETARGGVEVDKLEGGIEVETRNGDIDILNSTGTFQAKTGYGRLTFAGSIAPGGANHLESADGRVFASLLQAKDLSIEASGSNVDLRASPSFVTSTRQGNRAVGMLGSGATSVVLRAANGAVDLQIAE